jgi:serine/threonine protein kinase
VESRDDGSFRGKINTSADGHAGRLESARAQQRDGMWCGMAHGHMCPGLWQPRGSCIGRPPSQRWDYTIPSPSIMRKLSAQKAGCANEPGLGSRAPVFRQTSIIACPSVSGSPQRSCSRSQAADVLTLVMEYILESIHLFTIGYRKERKYPPLLYVRLWADQMFSGLRYLHSRRITYCHLKPQKMLVDKATGELRICDLGSAKRLRPHARADVRLRLLHAIARAVAWRKCSRQERRS